MESSDALGDVKEELFKFSIIIVVGILFIVATLYFGIEANNSNLAGQAYALKASSSWLPVLVLQAFSVYGIIAVILLVTLRRYNHYTRIRSLQDYFRKQLDSGYSEREVRNKLAKVGWSETAVNSAVGNQKP